MIQQSLATVQNLWHLDYTGLCKTETDLVHYPELLSPKQVADFLGVSESWLSKARSGHWPGPPYRQFRRKVLYEAPDVEKFLQERKGT